jgi:hypothetical protein
MTHYGPLILLLAHFFSVINAFKKFHFLPQICAAFSICCRNYGNLVEITGKSRFCCRNCGNLFVGIMGTYPFLSELWENHVFLLCCRNSGNLPMIQHEMIAMLVMTCNFETNFYVSYYCIDLFIGVCQNFLHYVEL